MEPNNQGTHSTKTQYCTLTMRYKFLSSNMNIKVEFGQNENLLKLYGAEIIKKTAQVTDIDNQVDGLNYMAYLGWEVVHLAPFETDSDGGTYQSYKYLMKRSY
jgi:hypothetical protein